MLAIQYIRMQWEKNNRNPQGAVKRRDYYKPHRISENAQLSADGTAFMQTLSYCQEPGGDIITMDEYMSRKAHYFYPDGKEPDFGSNFAHKLNLRIAENISKRKGKWYDSVEEIVIPSVEIFDSENGYDVYWHFIGMSCYLPFRKGYNVNYNRKGSRVKGQRLKCDRAFVLGSGESGVLRYNYRYSHGAQHYEQYCIYIVNTDRLEYNTFTSADYKKEYNEMVHLL